MKVYALLAFVLFVYCWYADGCSRSSSRGRSSYSRGSSGYSRRMSSYSRSSSEGSNDGNNYNFDLTEDNGQVGISADLEHKNDDLTYSVGGSLYMDGNWKARVGISKEFRKRSAQWKGNHYNITLQVDPCNFNTYDDNRDGTIIKSELRAIFGKNDKTDALFADLDTEADGEEIKPDEFNAMAPVIIAACVDVVE